MSDHVLHCCNHLTIYSAFQLSLPWPSAGFKERSHHHFTHPSSHMPSAAHWPRCAQQWLCTRPTATHLCLAARQRARQRNSRATPCTWWSWRSSCDNGTCSCYARHTIAGRVSPTGTDATAMDAALGQAQQSAATRRPCARGARCGCCKELLRGHIQCGCLSCGLIDRLLGWPPALLPREYSSPPIPPRCGCNVNDVNASPQLGSKVWHHVTLHDVAQNAMREVGPVTMAVIVVVGSW